MLASLWRLHDPVRSELHLIVYTWLSEALAGDALSGLRARWLTPVQNTGIHIRVIRMYRARAGESVD